MVSHEIVEMSACALSVAIEARQVSCREVMLATLAQIDRLNPATTAVHDVSQMLGPDRQQRLVHISASEDLAGRVRAATPW